MKRIIISLISIAFVFCNISTVSAEGRDEFVPKDQEMYSLFNKQLSKRTSQSIAKGNVYQEIKKGVEDVLIEPEVTKNIENFKDILVISNGETSKSVIKEKTVGDFSSVIVNDNQTNAKLYYEWESDKPYILLIVNNSKYLLKQTVSTIELISENNDRLVLSKTYYDNEESLATQNNNIAARAWNYKDNVYSSSDDRAYSADVGPLKATNKDIFQVFDVISLATGAISLIGKHPILGKISFVCAAISYVGNNWQGTFYIRFWQSHQLVTGGLTRNKERWFSESSCDNEYYVDKHTSYFNSTRPGY